MTTRTGGCLCGAVRYEATEAESDPMAPSGLGACHCQMCRKHTGGVMVSLNLGVDGLRLTKDEGLATYRSSDWAERGFCRICGSSLFWRLTMDGPMKGLTSICAGTLDDQSGLELTHEVYIDKKPAGYSFAQDTRQMTEADVMAMVAEMPGVEE